MLERKVLVKCRECDLKMIKGMIEEIQDEYAQIMKNATDADTYSTEIEVLETEFIKPESKEGRCGGLIITSTDKLIVCSNTLNERLNLCYEESLPVLRAMLFPKL